MRSLIDILFPVFSLIAVGYAAARLRIVDTRGIKSMSDLTFLLLSPALLFRSMAGTAFGDIPLGAPIVYFGATTAGFVGFAAWRFRTARRAGVAADAAIASASVQGFGAVFSNTFMLGLPLVRLVYGEPGLAILLTIIALHSLVLLSLATVVLEAGRQLTRASAGPTPALPALGQAARAALVNPVTLPILAGVGWSLLDLPLPRPVDTTLEMLGGSAPSLCLVLLGASLARFGIGAGLRGALPILLSKNLLTPVLVWLAGRLAGLDETTLGVMTVCAALPMGNNVYLFSQRYEVDQPVISVALLVSTLLGAVTLPAVLLLVR